MTARALKAKPFLPVAQVEALRRMVRNRGELMKDRAGWHDNKARDLWHAASGTVFALERKGFCAVDPLGGCEGVAFITYAGRIELRRYS